MTIKRLKDPPTWLKVATTLERPPAVPHPLAAPRHLRVMLGWISCMIMNTYDDELMIFNTKIYFVLVWWHYDFVKIDDMLVATFHVITDFQKNVKAYVCIYHFYIASSLLMIAQNCSKGFYEPLKYIYTAIRAADYPLPTIKWLYPHTGANKNQTGKLMLGETVHQAWSISR